MSKVKTEQRRVSHRGRDFHFVSYEGEPANLKRQKPAILAAWFLMSAGKRWLAIPHQPGQDVLELDRQLTVWLEEFILC